MGKREEAIFSEVTRGMQRILFRVKWRKALGSGNFKQVCTQVNIWIT